MDKYSRISEFLAFWIDIARQNRGIEFGTGERCDSIYNKLITLGVPKNEKTKQFNSLHFSTDLGHPIFDEFISYFKDDENLRVFCDPNWRYFCQFVTNNKQVKDVDQHIKMYIPLDADHLEEGAKQLFDFISKNEMTVMAKIGSEIRFDNIVVRVVEFEHFRLIMDFINNNEYIQEGLMEPNPFAFTYKGIALACDGTGNESFNGMISSLVDLYLGYEQRNHNLLNASASSFYQYVSYLYTNELVYGRDNTLEQYYKRIGKTPFDKELCKQLIKHVLDVSNENYDIYEFLNFYKNCCYKDLSLEETIELLKEAISVLANKIAIKKNVPTYRCRLAACNNIEQYLLTGNHALITRDYNLRNRIVNSNFKENLNYMLLSNGQDLRAFVEQLELGLEETRKGLY